MQPLLCIGFHWPSFQVRLLKNDEKTVANNQRVPQASKARNGHDRGRVIHSHEVTLHEDIGSAPGWKALMAMIAPVSAVPHRLEPRVIDVCFFSSIWIIYLEKSGPAQYGWSIEHLPVSSLKLPHILQHFEYSLASAMFAQ